MQTNSESTNSVQFTNVGGQSLPIIQGLLEFPCNKLVLLHSEESKALAVKISKEIQGDYFFQSVKNPNDFNEIIKLVSDIVETTPDSTFYANVSGGTKVMTLALFAFFANSKYKSKVFHIDQNGIIHFLIEQKTEKIKTTFPIEGFFNFSGQKIRIKRNFDNIPSEFFQVSRKAKILIERYPAQMNNLLNQFRNKNKGDQLPNILEIIDKKTGSNVFWDKSQKLLEFNLIRKGKKETVSFQIEDREYIDIILGSKWFELEVINILRNWENTREIAWNTVVPYGVGGDKNEIDIIVNIGSKLLFVECKTQLYDIKDIDKLRNVSKIYGGLGSKAVLVLNASPNKRTIEKCTDSNILLFSFSNDDNSRKKPSELITLLSFEILRTNPV